MSSDKKNDPSEPVRTAPPEVQQIIKEVLDLEKEKIYQHQPHINSDIINIIKRAVQ